MLDGSLYWRIVGGLQYVTMTRPNISFVVNQACQFMHLLTSSHLVVVKHIVCYLKGTCYMGILFHHSSD